MPARLRRLGSHLRRHFPVYVVGIFAFTFSPLPSMAAGLVTTDQIANGAVTTQKLATDSVIGTRILNESVTGVDIKNGAIGKADLALDSVSGPKVTNESLTGVDIKNGAIANADLGLNSVNGTTVADESLTIADLTPTTTKSLQSPSYRYVIPATNDGLDARLYSFPGLPRGIYLATYSIVTEENATSPVRCYLGDDYYRGFSNSALMGTLRSNNASAVLDLTDGVVASLECGMGTSRAGFEIFSDNGSLMSEVSFVRLDQVTDATIGIE